jgi:hypothetical protein
MIFVRAKYLFKPKKNRELFFNRFQLSSKIQTSGELLINNLVQYSDGRKSKFTFNKYLFICIVYYH